MLILRIALVVLSLFSQQVCFSDDISSKHRATRDWQGEYLVSAKAGGDAQISGMVRISACREDHMRCAVGIDLEDSVRKVHTIERLLIGQIDNDTIMIPTVTKYQWNKNLCFMRITLHNDSLTLRALGFSCESRGLPVETMVLTRISAEPFLFEVGESRICAKHAKLPPVQALCSNPAVFNQYRRYHSLAKHMKKPSEVEVLARECIEPPVADCLIQSLKKRETLLIGSRFDGKTPEETAKIKGDERLILSQFPNYLPVIDSTGNWCPDGTLQEINFRQKSLDTSRGIVAALASLRCDMKIENYLSFYSESAHGIKLLDRVTLETIDEGIRSSSHFSFSDSEFWISAENQGVGLLFGGNQWGSEAEYSDSRLDVYGLIDGKIQLVFKDDMLSYASGICGKECYENYRTELTARRPTHGVNEWLLKREFHSYKDDRLLRTVVAKLRWNGKRFAASPSDMAKLESETSDY